MNYTKEQVDNLLSIDSKWTLEKKQKYIKKLFKKFNARTNTSTKANQITDAERMMEVCAKAMLIYKSPAHKRNYKKKVVKKKIPTYKRKSAPISGYARSFPDKKTYDHTNGSKKNSSSSGCMIPIIFALSALSLIIGVLA